MYSSAADISSAQKGQFLYVLIILREPLMFNGLFDGTFLEYL